MTTPRPNDAPSAVLRDMWYFVCLSADVKPDTMQRKILLDGPVLIGRTKTGTAFAMRDVCPHRAAQLSAGRIVEDGAEPTVECPYHGWQMRTRDGVCAKIPALTGTSTFPVEKLRTMSYPVHEEKGTLWIYIPADEKRFDGTPAVPAPTLPTAVGVKPKMRIKVPVEGPYDEAVIGLVDPAHTPFVHQQWFWRRPGDAQEKIKHYQPTEMGFQMKAHPPSSNSRAYKIIGGAMTTEIEFRLPGLRLETIRNEKHTILGLTCITPLADGKSEITQLFFWDMMLLSGLRPLVYPLAKKFLGQDGHILTQQNANIKSQNPTMMYVEEPDELAKWYLKLKREWVSSRMENRPFANPLTDATLHWKT